MTGMMNERLNNLKPEGYIFYEADLFERRSLTNHHLVMSLVPLRNNRTKVLCVINIYSTGSKFFTALIVFPLLRLQLEVNHMLVDAVPDFQVRRCPLLRNYAILQHNDLINTIYRTHSMCNDKYHKMVSMQSKQKGSQEHRTHR